MNEQTILILLDELAELGLSDAEVDILVVRHGPVDLDILQACKKVHPAFQRRTVQKSTRHNPR